MAKIKMLRTQPGSPNGIAVVKYDLGQTYTELEMGADLVQVFLSTGAAIRVVEENPIEQKAIQVAPENQAIKSAPLNKSVGEKEEEEKKKSLPSLGLKRRKGLERSK